MNNAESVIRVRRFNYAKPKAYGPTWWFADLEPDGLPGWPDFHAISYVSADDAARLLQEKILAA